MKPRTVFLILAAAFVVGALVAVLPTPSGAIQATCVRCGPQNTCENVSTSWAAKCLEVGSYCATSGTCTIQFIISP